MHKLNCNQHAMFTICILFSTLNKTIGICEGASKAFPIPKNFTAHGRTVEIPESATAVEPCKFSAMFGSFCPFPIYGLVKIRQTCKLDICRLVNCWWDFFETGLYIDIGKHVKEWQVQREHSTCTSFSVFLNLILIGTRFKSTFWSMHDWVAKFTASKIWNSQLHLCVTHVWR